MVGNIGSKIKSEASDKIGQTGNVEVPDNVRAEVENFHQQIEDTKAHAAATAGQIEQGDQLIAEGNQLVNEGEQELVEQGSLGGIISAVPDALNDTFGEVPIVGAVTGLVADVADGLANFTDQLFSGFGLFGGKKEAPPPPPPPPPANVAGGNIGVSDSGLAPEAQANSEEKIGLGNQLIAEGEALNQADEATT